MNDATDAAHDFIAKVCAVNEAARREAMDVLRAALCMHCGDPNPDCQCWNDE